MLRSRKEKQQGMEVVIPLHSQIMFPVQNRPVKHSKAWRKPLKTRRIPLLKPSMATAKAFPSSA